MTKRQVESATGLAFLVHCLLTETNSSQSPPRMEGAHGAWVATGTESAWTSMSASCHWEWGVAHKDAPRKAPGGVSGVRHGGASL